MARSGQNPPNAANPYVQAVFNPAVRPYVAESTIAAGHAQQLIGYLGEPASPRRLYFTHGLDQGVDIPTDAIKYWRRLDPDEKHRLPRDVIYVTPDADLTYWSKHPPKAHEPKGGNGFPLDGPPFG